MPNIFIYFMNLKQKQFLLSCYFFWQHFLIVNYLFMIRFYFLDCNYENVWGIEHLPSWKLYIRRPASLYYITVFGALALSSDYLCAAIKSWNLSFPCNSEQSGHLYIADNEMGTCGHGQLEWNILELPGGLPSRCWVETLGWACWTSRWWHYNSRDFIKTICKFLRCFQHLLLFLERLLNFFVGFPLYRGTTDLDIKSTTHRHKYPTIH